MKHLDLFSGIGGFAYAIDQVWDNVEHIFCDNNKFCQQVLNKHWKGSKIYNDIRDIEQETADIVTGGFPCQPFSQAGKRKGMADDRYLWPEMLRVIKLAKPTWAIAENVRGLLTLQGGVVFEQVCLDLEASGYEVQPFIIPAVAKNAPHRRDRVWFIAHALGGADKGTLAGVNAEANGLPQEDRQKRRRGWEFGGTTGLGGKRPADRLQDSGGVQKGNDANSDSERYEGDWTGGSQKPRQPRLSSRKGDSQGANSWGRNWLEVATYSTRVDDGLPNRVDRIKALGNSIVPQIAVEIMKGIREKEI